MVSMPLSAHDFPPLWVASVADNLKLVGRVHSAATAAMLKFLGAARLGQYSTALQSEYGAACV
ncbi:hypothetical protein N9K47_00470, partial [bacterium]|nr:hypothetical protein [bacterium]